MSLKDEKHFSCDLKTPDGEPDCKVDYSWDPGAPGRPIVQMDPGVQAALAKAVAITYLLSLPGQPQYVTFYCCDEHAIEAIKRGQHLPPLPKKIQGATEAEMKAAERGLAVVDEMRNPSTKGKLAAK